MTLPLFTDDVPDSVRATVNILYSIEEWPQDWSKDADLVMRLIRLYPGINVTAEAVHFVAWFTEYREKHPRKQVKMRARFVNWMKNAKRFDQRRAKPPAKKEAHGETGVQGWQR